jgi:hypothetical protein
MVGVVGIEERNDDGVASRESRDSSGSRCCGRIMDNSIN